MRPTREVVVIVLAIAVGAGVVSSIVGLLVVEAVSPSSDAADGIPIAWDVLALMAGVVVGYILGTAWGGRGRD